MPQQSVLLRGPNSKMAFISRDQEALGFPRTHVSPGSTSSVAARGTAAGYPAANPMQVAVSEDGTTRASLQGILDLVNRAQASAQGDAKALRLAQAAQLQQVRDTGFTALPAPAQRLLQHPWHSLDARRLKLPGCRTQRQHHLRHLLAKAAPLARHCSPLPAHSHLQPCPSAMSCQQRALHCPGGLVYCTGLLGLCLAPALARRPQRQSLQQDPWQAPGACPPQLARPRQASLD